MAFAVFLGGKRLYHIVFCGINDAFYHMTMDEIRHVNRSGAEVRVVRCQAMQCLTDVWREMEECHLLFLHVGDGTGLLHVLEDFRRHFPHAVLTLCSQGCPPTAEMIRYHPYRYLILSRPAPVLAEEVQEILSHMRESAGCPYLLGRYYHNFIRVRPDDIIYIEKEKHGCRIHAKEEVQRPPFDRKIVAREKLGDLYSMLCRHGFAWPHDSYLINLKYLSHIYGSSEIVLADGTVLSISRSKSGEFMEKMLRYEEKISEILIKKEGKSSHFS